MLGVETCGWNPSAAIETGAGTPGNGQDWVVGHIVGRDNGAGSSATLTVAGMSLGGYTTALLATLDDDLARIALVIPLASLADFA